MNSAKIELDQSEPDRKTTRLSQGCVRLEANDQITQILEIALSPPENVVIQLN
jgi:hypothetical protein